MRSRRRMLLGLLGLIGLIGLVVAGLELNRRLPMTCPEPPPWTDLCAQYLPTLEARSTVAERQAQLATLRARLEAGEPVPLAAQQAVARAFLVVTAAPELRHNGLACGEPVLIVLRAGLSDMAHRYVLQHELHHLLYPERSEAETNGSAARLYPLGMLATVVASVGRAVGREGPVRCWLGGLWGAFRVYFLDLPA